ncbi:MAG: nuclear transport factor 2 family protein [Pseudomonadales bacterium]
MTVSTTLASTTARPVPARWTNARFALCAGLLLCGGCAGGSAHLDYAERYQAALARYPGSDAVQAEAIQRFIAFFTHSDAGAATDDAGDLYAPALYFSDTLLTSENHDEVVTHLQRMRSAASSLEVRLLDEQIDAGDVYLVWLMNAEFQPLRAPVHSATIGISHLRFDADGRIVLQQDFWDSTAGFYGRLPVLRNLIGMIAGRFQTDAP